MNKKKYFLAGGASASVLLIAALFFMLKEPPTIDEQIAHLERKCEAAYPSWTVDDPIPESCRSAAVERKFNDRLYPYEFRNLPKDQMPAIVKVLSDVSKACLDQNIGDLSDKLGSYYCPKMTRYSALHREQFDPKKPPQRAQTTSE